MIVVDSREQCPFPFIHERYEAKTKQGALTVWLSANAGRKPLSALGGISSRCEQCPRWAKSSSCSLD